jgi:hypothetical protein
MTCSGELEATDVRIIGSSTTVKDLIAQVAALKAENAECKTNYARLEIQMQHVLKTIAPITSPPSLPPVPPSLPMPPSAPPIFSRNASNSLCAEVDPTTQEHPQAHDRHWSLEACQTSCSIDTNCVVACNNSCNWMGSNYLHYYVQVPNNCTLDTSSYLSVGSQVYFK